MADNIVSFGQAIQSPSDQLQKVNIDFLYHSIKSPSPNLSYLIRQLRIIKELDARKYSDLKRQLPYFVCSVFNPPFRRTENFAYTQHFVVDLDHVNAKGLDLWELRQQIQKDPRVYLSFVSPGEDGLKVLFQLKEKCWDSGIYSLFYKAFARHFSRTYNLSEIIDLRTSDVCRACFLSSDNEVYYNPSPEPVDINSFIDIHDVSSMFEMKRELEREEKAQPMLDPKKESTADPDKDTMLKIRRQLQGKPIEPPVQNVFVPEELNQIIEEIVECLKENGIVVANTRNIQYGKNLQMQLGLKKAEINLFHGKRGFTVVECPRTGTNPELNHLCADLVRSFMAKVI